MHFLTWAIRKGWFFPFVVPFMQPFSSSRTTEIYGMRLVCKSISVITMYRAHKPSQPRFTRFGSILRWCKLFTWWILIINNDNYWLMIWLIPFVSFREKCYGRLRAVSLFSEVRRAKRETRKWPRAWLMTRDGFARLAASPLPRACIALTKSEEKERLLAV